MESAECTIITSSVAYDKDKCLWTGLMVDAKVLFEVSGSNSGVILSCCHTIILSYCHTVILSYYHTIVENEIGILKL